MSRLAIAFALFSCLILLPARAADDASTLTKIDNLLVDVGKFTVSDAEVPRYGVLVAMPARYQLTGRLDTEIDLPSGLLGGKLSRIPAGTPVWAGTYEGAGQLWCAPAQWDEGLMSSAGPASACFAAAPNDDPALYIGIAYAAGALRVVRQSGMHAQVTVDASVEFPPMEVVYRLDQWNPTYVWYSRGIRVNGEVYARQTLRQLRAKDGSATVTLNGYKVRLTPSGTKGGGRIELLSP